LLSGIIYKTLIELKIPFTLNDISGVTGINKKKIFKDEKKKEELKNIVIIDSSEILERVCSKLNLTFSDYTLIKENIKKSNNGFNPSTVISAHIYMYCKDKKIKILMKDICDITGISCMSIKRYIKKNVSS
jgi:transcription initiation factor TFIIIB Brf1 subunit/transcription initiation factor TFIIB